MSPKVSVITGFYNRASSLRQTIDSIMSQSFKDFELIVFNDASSDNTEEVLAEIEKEYCDERLIVINHPENIGFVQGMINAVDLAKGEYICVQGSGDISSEDRLLRQSHVLDSELSVVLVGCYYTNYVEKTGISRVREIVSDQVSQRDIVESNYFSHGEVMFRKSAYYEAGGYRPQFKNCQDYDLWIRMRKHGEFRTVKENLYVRFIREDGVSYEPSKFLKQSMYFFLVKDLSNKSGQEQERVLSKVDNYGIESLFLLSDGRLQKRIIKAVLRSTVWGQYNLASELNAKGTQNKIIKLSLDLFISLYSSWLGTPARAIARKKFNLG